MAVFDFGPKRFTITLSGTNASTVSPPTAVNGISGLLVQSTPAAAIPIDWGPSHLTTATYSGTTLSNHPPVQLMITEIGKSQQPYLGNQPPAARMGFGGGSPFNNPAMPGNAFLAFGGPTPSSVGGNRVTWIGIEALHPGVAQGLVSWLGVEVLHTVSALATRAVVSWMGLEVLNSGAANARVTWLGVEALHKGAAQSRVSWIGLEVLRTVADRPPDSGFVYLIAA